MQELRKAERDQKKKMIMLPVSGCVDLEVLEFRHMVAIRYADVRNFCEGQGLQKLTVLKFTFTPVTPKALKEFRSKFVLNQAPREILLFYV